MEGLKADMCCVQWLNSNIHNHHFFAIVYETSVKKSIDLLM